MNKRLIKYLLGFSLILALAGAACKGPTGSTGPEGPRGPQGEQGTMGEPGNANIMYSDWMNIEWDEAGSNETIKQMPILESRITQDFLNDGGLILMFMKVEGSSGNVVFYTLPLLTGGGSFYYRFVTLVGGETAGIVFLLQSLDDTTIPDYLWEDYQIRYVLVQGSVNLAAKGMDWENYNKIVEYYRIPE